MTVVGWPTRRYALFATKLFMIGIKRGKRAARTECPAALAATLCSVNVQVAALTMFESSAREPLRIRNGEGIRQGLLDVGAQPLIIEAEVALANPFR